MSEIKVGKTENVSFWYFERNKEGKVEAEKVLKFLEAMSKDAELHYRFRKVVKVFYENLKRGLERVGANVLDFDSLVVGKYMGVFEVLEYFERVAGHLEENGDIVSSMVLRGAISMYLNDVIAVIMSFARREKNEG